MKKWILSALFATGLFLCPLPVSAQTIHYPSIHAEVNSHSIKSIVVHNVTYPIWTGLRIMDTPYAYLGNGKFDIAGHSVQGVVYHGDTYLPWWSFGGSVVQASHIQDGWNITRKWEDTATDGYKLNVILAATSGTPKQFIPLWIQTFKSDGEPIGNQKFTATDTSDAPGYGDGSVIDFTGPDGTYYYAQSLFSVGNEYFEVDWTDPNGVTHTIHKAIRFDYPESTDTPVPSDDTVVAQTPIRVVNAEVLFDAKVNNVPVEWQLDTGAQVPTLNDADSAKLNLPHEQQITIVGVTGSDIAYISHMDVTIGGVEFKHVLCLVYPNMKNTSLFGFSFFAEKHYDLLVSEKHNTLSVLK